MVSVQMGRIRSGTWGSLFFESQGQFHCFVVVNDWQPLLQSKRLKRLKPSQQAVGRMVTLEEGELVKVRFIAAPPLLSREPCIGREKQVVQASEEPSLHRVVAAMDCLEQVPRRQVATVGNVVLRHVDRYQDK